MQHSNENIDELFKSAAEGYPLFTDNADWDYVKHKLSAKNIDNGSGLKKYTRQIGKWSAAALLLLIPVSIAVTNFSLKEASGKGNLYSKENNYKNAPEAATINNLTAKPLAENTTTATDKNFIQSSLPLYRVMGNKHTDKNSLAVKEAPNSNNVLPENKIDFLQQPGINKNLPDQNEAFENTNNIIADNSSNTLQENKVQSVDNAKQLVKVKLNKPKHFYVGALVAPEIASVKAQSVKKAGFNMGFILGYNINSRFQAELSFVLAHKYYYTDGKYSAPNSLRKDEAEIQSINAFNSITEVPITLRYNINSTPDHKFFVSAGLVSYVIHKELYNYDYTKNGQEREGVKKYNKSSDNLFSNMQISAGYERKLGNFGNMRIEPYYRLPLNGIGISHLPVASTGINFGLIKYIK